MVVLGRDPSVLYPEGCALPGGGAEDPFTHRPFFDALAGVACPRFLPVPSVANALGAAGGSTDGGGGGEPFAIDVAAAVAAFLSALRDPLCALPAAPV